MTRYLITPATRDDLDDIAAMVNAAYRGDTARRGWTHESDLLDGQRTDVRDLADEIAAPDPSTILILREAQGTPILACVLLQRYRDHDEVTRCHLAMLTVSPAAQNRGLGRLMVARAEDHARGLGCAAVDMTVIHLRTELLAWYERRGYRRTGRTKPFPYGDERVGVPTRTDLHFLELEKPLSGDA